MGWLLLAAYVIAGVAVAKRSMRWMREDLRSIGPLDDSDYAGITVVAAFVFIGWPIVGPMIALLTGHLGVGTSVGRWGESGDRR